MKKIALIPARYAATRFPAKLMQLLDGQPVIWHTYQNTLKTGLFDEVAVVTDSDIIFETIHSRGGVVHKSTGVYESGTDRITEVLPLYSDAKIIVNVQGDEPFVQREAIQKLLHIFEADQQEEVGVASLVQELKNEEVVNNPNYVKVVMDLSMNALLFSRSPIPFRRDASISYAYFEHIGIYGFRRWALEKFVELPMSPLESIEKIECLRFLENGIRIRMATTNYMGVEIDTPEDLIKASIYLQQLNSK